MKAKGAFKNMKKNGKADKERICKMLLYLFVVLLLFIFGFHLFCFFNVVELMEWSLLILLFNLRPKVKSKYKICFRHFS